MTDEQRDERHPVSWESFNWMRHEIERLAPENAKLQLELDYWKQQVNHWYMKATYTEEEIAEFYRRRSTEGS